MLRFFVLGFVWLQAGALFADEYFTVTLFVDGQANGIVRFASDQERNLKLPPIDALEITAKNDPNDRSKKTVKAGDSESVVFDGNIEAIEFAAWFKAAPIGLRMGVSKPMRVRVKNQAGTPIFDAIIQGSTNPDDLKLYLF